MRILWFTNTPSGYVSEKGGYNGGGWISSLEAEVCRSGNVQLGVAFFMNNQPECVELGGVKYFPIPKKNRLFPGLSYRKDDETVLRSCLKIVESFKPDIINVFGTERCFSLIDKYIDTPVVVHIQGLLLPYVNAFLPPAKSFCSYLFQDYRLRRIISRYRQFKYVYLCGSMREKEILHNCHYYIGRTQWDYNLVKLYGKNVTYYHGDEILRPEFYLAEGRNEVPQKLNIVTTISDVPYKGFDIVLKCAKILSDELHVDFEWNVFGNLNVGNRKKSKLEALNIKLRGVANAQTLIDFLTKCTCFVHPSYIDNSPNSVCEAQILGCPVVAQYVGGVPSLIDNNKTGILVPANDPYQMAVYIQQLHEDKQLNLRIGKESKIKALQRHDKQKITDNLIHIYNDIISTV